MTHKEPPYLMPKQRRKHAVSMAAELNSVEIDIEQVRRELTVPWPRPEVADRIFLRAQKVISILLAERKRLRAALKHIVDAKNSLRLDDYRAVERWLNEQFLPAAIAAEIVLSTEQEPTK